MKLKKKSFDFHEQQFKNKIFPLTEIDKLHDWLDEYADFLVRTGDDKNIAKSNKTRLRNHLQRLWNFYQIPIIKLPNEMKLEDIAKIFEKLNSTGRNLTTFDLLNARFIKHGIQIRVNLWSKALDYNNIDDYFNNGGEKLPVLILQNICLKRGKALKRSSILKLESSNFVNDWNYAIKNINNILDILKNLRGDFSVLSYSWIPYPSMLPALSELYSIADQRSNPSKCKEKICSWYWATCGSGNYDSSSDSKIVNDLTLLKNWFDDDSQEPSFIKNIDQYKISDAENIKVKSSAIYKSIICLIAQNGAFDFVTGERIENISELDAHHIFPRASTINLKNKNDINTILNKTLISKGTNRNYIRAKKPSEYINKISYEQKISSEDLGKRFSTHLISKNAFHCMMNDDFAGFIKERKKTIEEEFMKRIKSYIK